PRTTGPDGHGDLGLRPGGRVVGVAQGGVDHVLTLGQVGDLDALALDHHVLLVVAVEEHMDVVHARVGRAELLAGGQLDGERHVDRVAVRRRGDLEGLAAATGVAAATTASAGSSAATARRE